MNPKDIEETIQELKKENESLKAQVELTAKFRRIHETVLKLLVTFGKISQAEVNDFRAFVESQIK